MQKTNDHVKLLNLLRQNVKDERVIQMIKRYLKSGVMEDGVVRTTEGSPQGGNLSPLLVNIYLNEFDREFKRRGVHASAMRTILFCWRKANGHLKDYWNPV